MLVRIKDVRWLALPLALVCSGCFGGASTADPPALRPSNMFLGVACHVGGETGCGRIGVAAWLPRAAKQVRATLFGRTITLSSSRAGSGRDASRRVWIGFVRVAPSRIEPGAHVPVRIAVFRDGPRGSTIRSVYLSAGWG
jgi:hypothetical protein